MIFNFASWATSNAPPPQARRPNRPLSGDENTKSLNEFDDAWFCMADSDKPIYSRDYWGGETEYELPEMIDSTTLRASDLAIAIANFSLLRSTVRESLSAIKIETYPPARVVRNMFDASLFDLWDDVGLFDVGSDATWMIDALETKLKQAVTLLRPTVHMFLCSIDDDVRFDDDVPPPHSGDDFIGPFSQLNWASILDHSRRTIQNWESAGDLIPHSCNKRGKLYYHKSSKAIPPNIDQLIENFKLKSLGRSNAQ